MPRGSVKPLDEQLGDIDMKIQHYQNKINDLNNRKKTILASKEKEEMDALYQLVKASGKSPAELLTSLAK